MCYKRDRIFFKKYKGIKRRLHKEFLQRQAITAVAINSEFTKFKPQNRHDIIANTVTALCEIQEQFYQPLQMEWKRIPLISAFDGSEDNLIHKDLLGIEQKHGHYKNTIKIQKTAEDRFKVQYIIISYRTQNESNISTNN